MAAIGARLSTTLALLLVLSAMIARPAGAATLEPLELMTASGAHEFKVEIAKDDETRALGLMNRMYMAPDRGMLFEFDRDEPVTFWMKNTYIPLDMIFISPAGVVTNIVANAEPLSERIIPSGPALHRGARGERRRRRLDRAQGRRQGALPLLQVLTGGGFA